MKKNKMLTVMFSGFLFFAACNSNSSKDGSKQESTITPPPDNSNATNPSLDTIPEGKKAKVASADTMHIDSSKNHK